LKREELLSQSSAGIKKAEAIIQSMTIRERRKPDVLDASRRRRIAAGSGMQVSDVNELLRNFAKARDMAKRMGKLSKMLNRNKGARLPGMPFGSFS
jgi:signal recognition particle subunit SRP54